MSIGFIIMHHGGTSLDLPLTPSQSHRSVSSKMTDPGNILCWGGSVSPSTVQHIFPKKITFQSRIWISTCCYGNRHPFLPTGLVWPELVESFKKKKKKESFTYRCFSHWNATGCCQVLLLKGASVGEPSAEAGCPVKPSPKHRAY